MGLWRKGQSLNDWLTGRARGRREDDIITDPIPVRIIEHADGWGDWHATVNTSGEVPTKDANSAQLLTIATGADAVSRDLASPTFGARPAAAATTNIRKRILFVPVTTDGAGDSLLTPLVASLAGYQTCMRLDYIYTTGGDAAWDATISSTTGLTGPAVLTGLDSSGSETEPEWNGGLYYQNAADLEEISVTIANGGNTLTYYFAGVYWYET